MNIKNKVAIVTGGASGLFMTPLFQAAPPDVIESLTIQPICNTLE